MLARPVGRLIRVSTERRQNLSGAIQSAPTLSGPLAPVEAQKNSGNYDEIWLVKLGSPHAVGSFSCRARRVEAANGILRGGARARHRRNPLWGHAKQCG